MNGLFALAYTTRNTLIYHRRCCCRRRAHKSRCTRKESLTEHASKSSHSPHTSCSFWQPQQELSITAIFESWLPRLLTLVILRYMKRNEPHHEFPNHVTFLSCLIHPVNLYCNARPECYRPDQLHIIVHCKCNAQYCCANNWHSLSSLGGSEYNA